MFRLKRFINEDLGEIIKNSTYTKPMVLVEQQEKEYQLWLEPDYLYIKDLEIYAFCGTEYLYLEDEGEYSPDFDLVIFYDPKSGEELYSEGGSSFFVCVMNYCHMFDKSISEEQIQNYRCKYCEDNGHFLKEMVLGGFEIEDDSLKDDLEDAS